MKINGIIERVQLELLASDPVGASNLVNARIWKNTGEGRIKISNGTNPVNFLMNDDKAVLGTSTTSSENIRLHRAGVALLQVVTGNDVTLENNLSSSLGKLSFEFEAYPTASRPAVGNSARVIYDTDLNALLVDDGSSFKSLASGTEIVDAFINLSNSPASALNKLKLSAETTANLEALARDAGSLYYSTDEEKYYGDDGTQLIELGAGGAGDADTYLLQEFEDFKLADIESSGQNATYKVAGTFGGVLSLETTNPISKTTSLKYTAGVSSTNDWVNIQNTLVQSREKSVTNAREIWVDASNHSVDFDLIMYNISDGEVIEEARQTVIGGSSLKKYAVPFDLKASANTISYGFHINNAPVNGESILFDVVRLSVDPFAFMNLNTEENVFSAKIDNNGTATIISQTSDFISSVNRTAVGLVTVTFKTDFFAEIPSILATHSEPSSTGNKQTVKITNQSTTGFTFNSFNTNGVNTDVPVDIIIQRQGTDYKAPYESVAVPSKSNTFDTKIVQGITIEATTTDPVKPSNMEVDEIQYSQKGDLGFFKYIFRTDSTVVGANNGSGDYLFTLPNNLEFDSSKVAFYTVTPMNANDGAWRTYGTGGLTLDGNSHGQQIGIVPYDATRFRILISNNAATANAINSGFYQVALANMGWTVEFKIPIEGWTSENQFLSLIPVQKTAYLKDVKPNNTNAGTAVAGSYVTRDLTEISGDSEIVSLSANQFTLPAGKYEIEADAPYFSPAAVAGGFAHRAKIRNITDSSDAILGSNEFVFQDGTTGEQNRSRVKGTITISSPKTFELQQRFGATKTNGLGLACNFGDDEVYSQVKITKVK